MNEFPNVGHHLLDDEEFIMIPLVIWNAFLNEAKRSCNNPDRPNSHARMLLELEGFARIGKNISVKEKTSGT